jgi:hypothetical protein
MWVSTSVHTQVRSEHEVHRISRSFEPSTSTVFYACDGEEYLCRLFLNRGVQGVGRQWHGLGPCDCAARARGRRVNFQRSKYRYTICIHGHSQREDQKALCNSPVVHQTALKHLGACSAHCNLQIIVRMYGCSHPQVQRLSFQASGPMRTPRAMPRSWPGYVPKYCIVFKYVRTFILPGCKQIVREGGTERALVSEARAGHEASQRQFFSGRQGGVKPGSLKLGVRTCVFASGTYAHALHRYYVPEVRYLFEVL